MSSLDDQLRRREAESQRAFFRVLAGGSEGGRLLELGDVQANVCPARPVSSIFNSIVYRTPEALEDALPELSQRYAEAGVEAWTVWVPPWDERAPSILEVAGYLHDASPMLMAAPIEELDLEPRTDLDLHPDPSWELLGRLNTLAWGYGPERAMEVGIGGVEDPATRLYSARLDGEPVAILGARVHEGDCYFIFVATVPAAKGRGLASELMRLALREALGRGATTTTLEASPAGEPVYDRLGFRSLGRYGMWERRSA